MSKFVGCAVESLAGRDIGTICLVIRAEGEYLLLADGRGRKVEKPKKKKSKHVRLITDKNEEPIRFDGQALTNRFVRTWLRDKVGCEQV